MWRAEPVSTTMSKERLAEEYKKYADRSRHLAETMQYASAEATESLGAAPEWTEDDE